MKKLFIYILLFHTFYQSFAQPNGNLVVFVGNSVTYGYKASTEPLTDSLDFTGMDYPAQCVRKFNCGGPYTFYNLGGTGADIKVMIANADGRINQKYKAAFKNNILIPYEFINTLRGLVDYNISHPSSSISDEKIRDSAYLLFVKYCKARKDSGWKVIIPTIMPFSGYNQMIQAGWTRDDSLMADKARVAINNLLRTHYRDYAESLIDIADNPFIIRPDKTHPDDAGYGIIASAVYTAIQNIFKVSDPASFSGNYYSKPTGNLHDLATWGTNTDGSGENPLDFNGVCKIFRLANRGNTDVQLGEDYYMTADWTVAGTIGGYIRPLPTDPIGAVLHINGHTLSAAGLPTWITAGPTSSLIVTGNTGGEQFFQFRPLNSTSGSFKDLTVNRTGPNAALTLVDPVNIYGVLSVKNGMLKSDLGRFVFRNPLPAAITLKSDANNTARVAPITGGDGNGIDTDVLVTVERYIPARRAWRIMAAPVQTGKQTINAAWQEGATTSSAIPNPNPGFGTHITEGNNLNGFDHNPVPGATTSIKKYISAIDSWVTLTNTNNTDVASDAYLLFVRGDRGTVLGYDNVPPTETILRSTGYLKQGLQIFPVSTKGFTAIPNPFASPIDFEYISKTNTLSYFYVWDPKLGGQYGGGGYVLVSRNANGGYDVSPKPVSPESQYIQSGQGFFVKAADNDNNKIHQIAINESSKAATPATNVFRSANTTKGLRTSLQGINKDKTTYLVDETYTIYGDLYSNKVDEMDPEKLPNINENLGIIRAGQVLMIERRREIEGNDTIQLKLWNTTKTGYILQFSPEHLSSSAIVSGYLEDNYLRTSSPISLSEVTKINFTVDTNPASSNPERFRVVLVGKAKTPSAIPVTKTGFKLAPNPIIGNTINIQFNNQPNDIYNVELVNSMGQVVYRGLIKHEGGSATKTIQSRKSISKGEYRLKITNKQLTILDAIPVLSN